jgi:chitin synthase
VQLVVFILRSRYDFLFWFVYFTLIGVPFFYFFLPLYAFWHMDDFSWGETRKVAAMKQSFSSPTKAIEDGDADYDSESTGESDEEGSEYYDNDGEEEGYSRRGDGERSQYSRRSGEGSRYSSSRRG